MNVIITGRDCAAGDHRHRRHGHRDAPREARVRQRHPRQAGHRLLMLTSCSSAARAAARARWRCRWRERQSASGHVHRHRRTVRRRPARARRTPPRRASAALDDGRVSRWSWPTRSHLVPDDHFLIVDCLTVWLGNLFVHVMDAPTISRYGHDMNDALRARNGRDGGRQQRGRHGRPSGDRDGSRVP